MNKSNTLSHDSLSNLSVNLSAEQLALIAPQGANTQGLPTTDGAKEIASQQRVGDDLVIVYADGSEVVMEGYFLQEEEILEEEQFAAADADAAQLDAAEVLSAEGEIQSDVFGAEILLAQATAGAGIGGLSTAATVGVVAAGAVAVAAASNSSDSKTTTATTTTAATGTTSNALVGTAGVDTLTVNAADTTHRIAGLGGNDTITVNGTFNDVWGGGTGADGAGTPGGNTSGNDTIDISNGTLNPTPSGPGAAQGAAGQGVVSGDGADRVIVNSDKTVTVALGTFNASATGADANRVTDYTIDDTARDTVVVANTADTSANATNIIGFAAGAGVNNDVLDLSALTIGAASTSELIPATTTTGSASGRIVILATTVTGDGTSAFGTSGFTLTAGQKAIAVVTTGTTSEVYLVTTTNGTAYTSSKVATLNVAGSALTANNFATMALVDSTGANTLTIAADQVAHRIAGLTGDDTITVNGTFNDVWGGGTNADAGTPGGTTSGDDIIDISNGTLNTSPSGPGASQGAAGQGVVSGDGMDTIRVNSDKTVTVALGTIASDSNADAVTSYTVDDTARDTVVVVNTTDTSANAVNIIGFSAGTAATSDVLNFDALNIDGTIGTNGLDTTPANFATAVSTSATEDGQVVILNGVGTLSGTATALQSMVTGGSAMDVADFNLTAGSSAIVVTDAASGTTDTSSNVYLVTHVAAVGSTSATYTANLLTTVDVDASAFAIANFNI